jgi:site-specific recombinase XerD
LTTRRFVEFQRHLERAGLASSTVRHRLAALGAFYRHAVAAQFCESSPVVDIRRPPDTDGRPPTDQAITEEELARLISHARAAGPHEEAIVLLLGDPAVAPATEGCAKTRG